MAASVIRATVPAVGGLVAEQCGPHVLIRQRDEAGNNATVLSRIPPVPGSALVLASAAAHRHPGLLDALRGCVATLRFQRRNVPLRTVWLGVSDLGNPRSSCVSWLHRLSVEFGTEIVAPHGALIAGRGIGLYIDRASSGTGWRCFSPGSDGKAISCRFPIPAWEYQLPQVPLFAAGLVTEPVPAGVAVSLAESAPPELNEPQFQIPLHLRTPKLVVGDPDSDIAPAAVAEMINRLPGPVWEELLVVPVAVSATTTAWAHGLAVALNRGVTVATGQQVQTTAGTVRTVVRRGDGAELLEPIATILRHTPDGAPPAVTDVVVPPAGWRLSGMRCYLPVAPSEAAAAGVLAEVLPGGLHVRLDTDRPSVTVDFDPCRWTLVVGDDQRDVTDAEVVAVCDLLEGLGPLRCRTVDIHVLGRSWQYALDGFEAHLRSLGVVLNSFDEPARVRRLGAPAGRRWRISRGSPGLALPAAPLSIAAADGVLTHRSVVNGPAPGQAVTSHRGSLADRMTPAPRSDVDKVIPLSINEMTIRFSPVAVESESLESGVAAAEPNPPAVAPMDVVALPVNEITTSPALAAQAPAAQLVPAAAPVAAVPVATMSGPRPEARPVPRLEPEDIAPSEPAVDPVPAAPELPEVHVGPDRLATRVEPARPAAGTRARMIELADRSSTATEQTRFGLSAGEDYTEGLAAVNVALSAWPMLRAESKADYVAVCLYLGRGRAGAGALNEALGTGAPEPFDGYLPCLVSGLRRLPTHRNVVLRQETLPGADDCPYPEGSILSEPGFLSASAQLDVTTSAADLDLLIWPVSARRTSELVTGRAIDETVFPAGRRFKALALRTHEPEEDGPRAPGRALLVRELLADEDPESAEALARDATVLPRLDRAWARRRQAELRVIDDEDLIARLTTPMERATDTGQATRQNLRESFEAAS